MGGGEEWGAETCGAVRLKISVFSSFFLMAKYAKNIEEKLNSLVEQLL